MPTLTPELKDEIAETQRLLTALGNVVDPDTIPAWLQTPNDASLQASLELPHERDQQADSTGGQPSTKMKQAGRDLSHGVQDTSRAPEMNRAYEQVKKHDGSA